MPDNVTEPAGNLRGPGYALMKLEQVRTLDGPSLITCNIATSWLAVRDLCRARIKDQSLKPPKIAISGIFIATV